jgi:hypothetical protein
MSHGGPFQQLTLSSFMQKSQFVTQAKPISVNVNGQTILAAPKQFSTGSVGFFANGKIPVTLLDGTPAVLQVSASLTVCGSKDWPK